MERETRFELATLALARRCSTTELLPLVAELSIPGGPNAVKPAGSYCDRRLGGLAWFGQGAFFFSHNLAVAHEEDASGNGRGLWIMGDHEGGLAQFAIGPDQHLENGFGVSCVQVAGWLVREHDCRAGNEGAGNGYTLLLAATQFRGPVIEPPLDGKQMAEVVKVFQVQRLFAPADGVGNLNVAHGGEGGQQVELLEDKSDAVFAQPGSLRVVEGGKIDAIDDHTPAGGLGEPAEQVEKGGFARTGRPYDGHKLPRLNGQRNTVHRGHMESASGINLGQILGQNDGRRLFGRHDSIVNATYHLSVP